ncbi:trypsin-like peptidase domain-containing protein [bacterium]|nr:trypsin-like peptidase domain-containing protein [bacterium]
MITAAHVVAECDRAKVVIINSALQPTGVTAIVSDARLDLALLTTSKPFTGPTLPISTQSEFQFGMPVSAWGYPAGYRGERPLLAVGFISGAAQVKTDGGVAPRFFINAAFNPGNSGGPLLNLDDGSVIGVVSSKLDPYPNEIVAALNFLRTNSAGFSVGVQLPDGTTREIHQGQLLGEILEFMRDQTQTVVGHTTTTQDLRTFLTANGIEP